MNGGESHMRSQRADEGLLVKYLLGNLAEEEQVQVEDRAFAEADYMGALEAAEADLIDSYVRGELSQPDRRSFELRFLTSARRRSKIEFARALSTLSAEAKVREPARRPSLMSVLRAWNPGLQFAAAMAALFCLAGISWLVFDNATSRSQVAALQSQRRASELREETLKRQLREEQQTRQTAERGEAPLIASLILPPGVSRAQTRVERLVLSPLSQIAHIEMQLEPRDNFPRFRAELRTKKGEEILSASNLVRRKVGAGYVVSFDVPASALQAGEYELSLKGVSANRVGDDIGFYYFTVQKR
jgi:hypothetical protein